MIRSSPYPGKVYRPLLYMESLEEIFAVDDDNVCTAPIMADKDIMELVQSSNADSDDEMIRPTSSEKKKKYPSIYEGEPENKFPLSTVVRVEYECQSIEWDIKEEDLTLFFHKGTKYIETFVIPLDKLQKILQVKTHDFAYGRRVYFCVDFLEVGTRVSQYRVGLKILKGSALGVAVPATPFAAIVQSLFTPAVAPQTSTLRLSKFIAVPLPWSLRCGCPCNLYRASSKKKKTYA
ncbi:hypothetical protein TNCV_2360541 [Trichonephila clavipes]|nr:hypothetical protein TNCV_2360541 [Trichonephila clavipes]